MNVRLAWNCLLILFYLALLGCTLKTVDTIESGNMNTRKSRVLIATQKSKFKSAVVKQIKETLGNDVYYVKVVDVRWLPNETIQGYSAIVIINRCMAGRPDPRVESFIDTVEEKNKVILLTTGQLDSWKPESSQVDAMTSASVMSETNVIAQSIADKVLSIIASQKNI